MTTQDQTTDNDTLLTFQVAAVKLGVPVYKVRRAARAGLFPTYRLLNTRKLVRLSDIKAAIETVL